MRASASRVQEPKGSTPYFLAPNQPENQPPPEFPAEAEVDDVVVDDFPPAFFFSWGGLKTLRISIMRRSNTCSIWGGVVERDQSVEVNRERTRYHWLAAGGVLTDVLVILGRRFDETRSQLLSDGPAFIGLDLPTSSTQRVCGSACLLRPNPTRDPASPLCRLT